MYSNVCSELSENLEVGLFTKSSCELEAGRLDQDLLSYCVTPVSLCEGSDSAAFSSGL